MKNNVGFSLRKTMRNWEIKIHKMPYNSIKHGRLRHFYTSDNKYCEEKLKKTKLN
jgi:hypothetical protein